MTISIKRESPWNEGNQNFPKKDKKKGEIKKQKQERKGTNVVSDYLHDLSILKNVSWGNKITIDLQFQAIKYP